jgi:hypothetical protein
MRYFPPGMWGTLPNFHANLAEVISDSLLDMDEYPLWQEESPLSLYRFFLFRNFHPPLCIMLAEAEQDAGDLTAKISSSPQAQHYALPKSGRAEWVKQGKTYYQATHRLTPSDYQTIQRGFEEANFWEMPSTDENSGRDGSIWVVEAVANGQYHAVMRWSPSAGVFRDLALTFLHVAEISVDPLY